MKRIQKLAQDYLGVTTTDESPELKAGTAYMAGFRAAREMAAAEVRDLPSAWPETYSQLDRDYMRRLSEDLRRLGEDEVPG